MTQPLTTRNLSLAHAAIEHALYFLEINAYSQAAQYFRYAAEQCQGCAEQFGEPEHPQAQWLSPETN